MGIVRRRHCMNTESLHHRSFVKIPVAMRVSATAVAAWWCTLLCLVVTLASASLVHLNGDLLAVDANSRLSFSEAAVEPVPQNLLAAIEYGSSTMKCDVVEAVNNSGQATVVVAISKCLNASAIAVIEAWVDSLVTTKLEYVENGLKKKLTIASMLIKDQCTGSSSVSKATLLSEEVQPDEVARIQSFARFGRVLQQAPTSWTAVPIAAISFVYNPKSYEVITQYENRFNISNTFRFQFCQGGSTCTGSYQNTVALDTNVDLFLYNPFKITSSNYCSKLADGIPVQYVNSTGSRDCFCTCSAQSQIEDTGKGKKCVSVEPATCPCVWNTMGGFVVTNKDNLTQCRLSKLASGRGLPVPNPQDNYVANKINTNELTTGPRIEVTITPAYSTVYEYIGAKAMIPNDLPQTETDMFKNLGQNNTRVNFKPTTLSGQNVTNKYAWLDYRQNSKAKIDELAMGVYGKYDLLLTAYDYSNPAAKCVGCVAFVDGYRPKRTTQCPVAFRDTTVQASVATAELTTGNVAKVAKLVSDFYNVQLNATNDACSSSANAKQRCDYEDYKLKTFFANDYVTKTAADSKTIFATAEIEADFKKGGVTNPLEAKARDGTACQDNVFVQPSACSRCGRYESRLQEYWIDYRCGYDYSMQYCSGDANETCVFHQCLVLVGPSIANVSMSIKSAIVAESKNVFTRLTIQNGQPPGLVPTTQIVRALTCSTLSSSCNYKVALADVFDVSVANKLGGSSSTFVFWRYQLDCESASVGWRLWNPLSGTQVTHLFKDKVTTITLEAWTACGIVNRWTFTVNLYVTSSGKLKLSAVDANTATSNTEMVPTLVAVCAVVAVAALLVVRRRFTKTDATVAMEDAYRPLLN